MWWWTTWFVLTALALVLLWSNFSAESAIAGFLLCSNVVLAVARLTDETPP